MLAHCKGRVYNLAMEVVKMEELTKELLDAKIREGLNDIEDGRVYTADEVEAELRGMKRQKEDTTE